MSSTQPNGKLSPDLPFLFNAAKKLGSTHNELLLLNTSKETNYKSEIATFASPAKVYNLSLPSLFTIEEITNTLISLLPNFTHALAPNSSFYKDLIPRIAGKLDMQPITDIIAIDVLLILNNRQVISLRDRYIRVMQ
jgi:electron transfer flavoprotein alpha subunit